MKAVSVGHGWEYGKRMEGYALYGRITVNSKSHTKFGGPAVMALVSVALILEHPNLFFFFSCPSILHSSTALSTNLKFPDNIRPVLLNSTGTSIIFPTGIFGLISVTAPNSLTLNNSAPLPHLSTQQITILLDVISSP